MAGELRLGGANATGFGFMVEVGGREAGTDLVGGPSVAKELPGRVDSRSVRPIVEGSAGPC
ncbi:MAG: hypothetical protein ACO1SV_12255 [Fimbriimonas sp.]